MTSDEPDVNGLLLVDKPGLDFPTLEALPRPDVRSYATSHDVVQQVRRLSRQRRIGHTGTLDPMASGLLVLCLGRTTRLVEYYQGHSKRYRAEITLGYATDTYDALGVMTEQQPVPAVTIATLEQALATLRAATQQMPPIYSALKQGGESIHYKARRGEEVAVEPRTVQFHEITLVQFAPPSRVTLEVHCSAGAYMRSLAYDLGRALGTVATLTGLRRIAAGPFTVAEAHTPAEIAAAAKADRLADLLLPTGDRLDLPTYTAAASVIARLGFGQVVARDELMLASSPTTLAAAEQSPDPTARSSATPQLAQLRSAEGLLLGIVRAADSTDPSTSRGWRAEKWFA